MPHWQVLALDLFDSGSGIAPESISVQLDGQTIIVEPDLPRDRILVEFPDDMAPGSHHLEVKVSDEAGNPASQSYQVFCEAK